jgi:hypothetical protein
MRRNLQRNREQKTASELMHNTRNKEALKIMTNHRVIGIGETVLDILFRDDQPQKEKWSTDCP